MVITARPTAASPSRATSTMASSSFSSASYVERRFDQLVSSSQSSPRSGATEPWCSRSASQSGRSESSASAPTRSIVVTRERSQTALGGGHDEQQAWAEVEHGVGQPVGLGAWVAAHEDGCRLIEA